MKVYQINCSSYGSTGKLALAIHQRLLEAGEESRVGYGYGKCKKEGTYRISNWLDIRLHARLSKYTGLIGWFSVICTLRLLLDIKQFNPDIIHLHNLHGNYVNIPLLLRYLRKSKKKILFTLHDCFAFTGKCPHYTMAGCNKWKDYCYDCPQLRDFPCIRLFDTSRLLYRQKKKLFTLIPGARITTVSQWLANEARQSYLRTKRIDVVPNGIDTTVFQIKALEDTAKLRTELCLEGKIILLGVASSWSRQKGLNQWYCLRDILDSKYAIVLIGLSKLQAEGLPTGIFAIEKTENQEQLADYYNIADLLINMSQEESFGLVTVEAMACGTPVIVSPFTANPELVNKERGMIVDTTDVEAIRKGIEHIINVGKSYYKPYCRSFVEKGYTTEVMYCIYHKIYRELLM